MTEKTRARALLADAFVAAEIERALAPFEGVLEADELAWMRARLADEIVDDSALLALLDGAYPRTVDDSGEQLKGWLSLLREGQPSAPAETGEELRRTAAAGGKTKP